jgi:cob(I)alamin adenosyltransferase
MGITTKTGDNGYTGILDGRRLRKDHPILECLGTLDELNAFLGDAKACLNAADDAVANAYGVYISGIITGIQKDLSSIMGILAGMPVPEESLNEERLNSLIGELESELPPFTSFAVPGANPASAKLHIARTVCRRAERRLTALNGETSPASQAQSAEQTKAVMPYINRLSDLLFLLARKASAVV